jgi:hypothetical protein
MKAKPGHHVVELFGGDKSVDYDPASLRWFMQTGEDPTEKEINLENLNFLCPCELPDSEACSES